jgi:hypothetical protein
MVLMEMALENTLPFRVSNFDMAVFRLGWV